MRRFKKVIILVLFLIAISFLEIYQDSESIIYIICFLFVIMSGGILVIKKLNNDALPKQYINLGNGLDWFNQYREIGAPTLSKFFDLHEENKIKIKAIISKTGFYKTSKGKRWAVIAKYFDKNDKKEYTFYCPEFDYDPSDDFKEGDILYMYVEKGNYSKYEMPIY